MTRPRKSAAERAVKVGVSLVPGVIAQLDNLAGGPGGNRSAVVSRLITEAARGNARAPEGPAMLDNPTGREGAAQMALPPLERSDRDEAAARQPYIDRIQTRLKAMIYAIEDIMREVNDELIPANSAGDDQEFEAERDAIREVVWELVGDVTTILSDFDNGLGVSDDYDGSDGPEYDGHMTDAQKAQLARDVRDGKREWGMCSDAFGDECEAALAREESSASR
ncbi:MAG: hypothetical protein JWM87_746 [Candidatus Eremiobacteraeota bacterium]|nr:hypothetical protein [Candidatus Eremiobacteraeota bacterium]